ncbi:hypothetical protein GCK32_018813, partial [Trichostrongylus colubriformis]
MRSVNSAYVQRNVTLNVKYDRWLTVRRGRNGNERPHTLAIADSPVFTIEFTEIASNATIYAILSRLRTRSDISIEFASYELVNRLYFWDDCPYANWTLGKQNEKVNAATDGDDVTMKAFLKDTVRKEDVDEGSTRTNDIIRARTFSLLYMIECLIS